MKATLAPLRCHDMINAALAGSGAAVDIRVEASDEDGDSEVTVFSGVRTVKRAEEFALYLRALRGYRHLIE